MNHYPIGIQDFTKLRERNYLYIDKTEYMYSFVRGGYYFLSRPRRFGKSLLISTLEQIFLGNQAVFKGLWIENKIEWEERPVIRFDFGMADFQTIGLEKSLHRKLNRIASKYKISLSSEHFSSKFEELIIKLSQIQKVAILIDEYDKPIIEFLDRANLPEAQKNRAILKQFYSVIKGMDAYIHFFFLTGVSKFSRVSIFSDLNHLNDITLDYNYSCLLGYTQIELEKYFAQEIKELAEKQKVTKEKMLIRNRLQPLFYLEFYAEKTFY